MEQNRIEINKEKQIEELAKIFCGMKNSCDECMWDKVHCNERNYAEEIYNANYRKQSEGVANNTTTTAEWISVEERLPEPEKEVLVFAIRRYKFYDEIQEVPVITTALYEDGSISNEDSVWNWYDIDFIYDEENDIEYIPEGWWEYRHYNPDDIYNNAVDDKVTHWMPLPEPPKMKGGGE